MRTSTSKLAMAATLVAITIGSAASAEESGNRPTAPGGEVQLASSGAITMDTVVVTPTGDERLERHTLPAVSVVDREEIRAKQLLTVEDALREVPGVTVVRSGSLGASTSVFLRGANGDQVLVLVDGVRVNSNTLGSFDFGNLLTDDLDRIEVLRGAAGTALHGSEAIGGVVHVVTRRGDGPPKASASFAFGNGSTHREQAEASGRTGPLAFSASLSQLDTDGFEGANDFHRNVTAAGSAFVDTVAGGSAGATIRFVDAEFGNRFSNNFLGVPDPNARLDARTLVVRGEVRQPLGDAFQARIGLSHHRDDSAFDDGPDAGETSTSTSDILSERFTLEGRLETSFLDGFLRGVWGVELDRREADLESTFSDPAFGDFPSSFEERVDSVAGFVLHDVRLGATGFQLTGGVRVDENDRFGFEASPTGGLVWELDATGTRLRFVYAEGFKAPTFNQLFFPGFGNPALGAETSWEVEGGIDQVIGDRARFSVAIFHREVDDLIAGVPEPDGFSILAQNVGEVETDGVEVAIRLEPFDGVAIDGTYTWLDVQGPAAAELRRPRHSGSLAIGWMGRSLMLPRDQVTADLRLLLVGDRRDIDPTAGFTFAENESYERVDLALAWDVPVDPTWLRRLGFFLRFENLLDADYEETLGFPARPLAVLGGIRLEV